jgi:transposase-like protein
MKDPLMNSTRSRSRPLALASDVIDRRGNLDALPELLARYGCELLPSPELLASDTEELERVIDRAGVCVVEAVLKQSVADAVGPKQPGHTRPSGVVRFGSQRGVLHLADRTIPIIRPRVRRTRLDGTSVEEPVPAYQMLREAAVQSRISKIVLNGVSTRRYKETIVGAAEAMGVSKSSVSREFVEQAEAMLKELLERPLGELDIVVVLIDAKVVAHRHVLVAIGVDMTGTKHVLGIREGASENARVATELLEDLVARGLTPERPRLFVIDGSKALRAAIGRVFGRAAAVQRCRIHKVRNVCDQLPEDAAKHAKIVMNAAFGLTAEAGMQKLRSYAKTLQEDHPSAAASLLEGLEEMFTLNRLQVPEKLARSLCSTNMIESPNSALQRAIGRVTRWRDTRMILRWVGSALLKAEGSWRRLDGSKQLWILDLNLRRHCDYDTTASTPPSTQVA